MLEKQIETNVCQYARDAGMLVFKFTSPSRAAVPDRLLITEKGTAWFIEFKRTGEKPTSPQIREHERLREHKVMVFVVDSVEMGRACVDAMRQW